MKSVLCVVGTRPEAIKMAPVILELRRAAGFRCRVLATAQHRELLDQVLRLFGIVPDIDLDIMEPGQGLTTLTGRLLLGLDAALRAEAPDIVLAQGDTTTVMATALAAFYAGLPFGHVEAGLRTGDILSPFPEELNRILTTRMTRWHFAPTSVAAECLRSEGQPDERIFVTGNTVIDALHLIRPEQPERPPGGRRRLLVTVHRRENFGEPLRRICEAIGAIVARNRDVEVLMPVHPNPNVRAVVAARLGGRERVTLSDPLDYRDFVAAMADAYLILSDSGGVQEEAPALGKPVLVLRSSTERPEAVAAGVTALVGTDADTIAGRTQELLDDRAAYARMAVGRSPYGDGKAAQRIVDILRAA